jgi:hypothetical protein
VLLTKETMPRLNKKTNTLLENEMGQMGPKQDNYKIHIASSISQKVVKFPVFKLL